MNPLYLFLLIVLALLAVSVIVLLRPLLRQRQPEPYATEAADSMAASNVAACANPPPAPAR